MPFSLSMGSMLTGSKSSVIVEARKVIRQMICNNLALSITSDAHEEIMPLMREIMIVDVRDQMRQSPLLFSLVPDARLHLLDVYYPMEESN